MQEHTQPVEVKISADIAQSMLDTLSINLGRLQTLLFDAKYTDGESLSDKLYIDTLQQSIKINERNIATLRDAIQNAYIETALNNQ